MGGGGREREMRGMRAKGARRGGALTPCGTAAEGAASVRSAHETQEQPREAKAAAVVVDTAPCAHAITTPRTRTIDTRTSASCTVGGGG